MAAPRKVDYERIEPGWRAGIKSPQHLAADYTDETGVAVSITAIVKHFRKLGVPRDLAAKVRAKADAMVLDAMVSGKVSAETIRRDTEIINATATLVAGIELSQRSDIRRGRALVIALLAELECETGSIELFEKLGELMEAPGDRTDKLNETYQKALSLSGRVTNMKSLAEALKTLIAMERQAFKMDDADPTLFSGRQLTDLEIAARMAYFIDLGQRRRAEAAAE